MRRLSLFLVGLAILAGINATVWRFERAMGSGEVGQLIAKPENPRRTARTRRNKLCRKPTADKPFAQQKLNLEHDFALREK